ncbi:hypothetical protein GCM10009753_59500 [Streptantibioticus ferralitis]
MEARGLPDETASDAVLAVSELVANATEHANGPYELWLRGTPVYLVCEVHDRDPRVPQLPVSPATMPFAPVLKDRGGGLSALCVLLAERGRGLQIVHHLSRGLWGYRLSGNGTKVAWIAIPAEWSGPPCAMDGWRQ